VPIVAVLGIANEFANGLRAVGDLATTTATLHRLLRALAAVEVLREEPDGMFGLSGLGEALRGPAETAVLGSEVTASLRSGTPVRSTAFPARGGEGAPTAAR
jgi:hypothetical protein